VHELGLWQLTSHKISDIFGQRLHRPRCGTRMTMGPRTSSRM
jgi:hypothetical protein